MDTIVAIATPPGRSAIGVVRLSGPQSLEILRALTRDAQFSPEPNRVTLKQIRTESGALLDSVLISYFLGPHSFTGEDMAEIGCHGSPVILRQLLDGIQSLGPRLATPGEFTLRACMNGKMNLSQAEAIRDLINAQTEVAARQAARQLKGELSDALQPFKQELIKIIVRLESALEFVEDNLPEVQVEENRQTLTKLIDSVGLLADTFGSGHLLRDGIRATIVGRPNVGKSSLFNKLVRLDRAIVTAIAGTTRDSISEGLNIGGIPIVLTDTAGIRDARDEVEKMGVERTHRAISDADLLIVVVDGSVEPGAEDIELLVQAKATKHIIAINKCDLPSGKGVEVFAEAGGPLVHLSALTGAGLDELTAAILALFSSIDSDQVGLLVTNSRHHDLLRRAQAALAESLEEMSRGASEELVLVGLHNGLRFLGEITGETTTEDILSEIFSTFCIGK
jgi:tRNA modification GTPase